MSDQTGLKASLGSQEENEGTGRTDNNDSYQSTMPDILFYHPTRPNLPLKIEINLLGARAYVHWRLFDNKQYAVRLSQDKSDLEGSINDGPSNQDDLEVGRSRKPRCPQPFELRLHGVDPNAPASTTQDGRKPPYTFPNYPDLTCRELDNVYHALRNASSRHQNKDKINNDPALVRALDAIRHRLNLVPVNSQG